MSPQSVVIHLEAAAPAKPAWGAPCNGCGVCCALEPCPLGVWLSRRRRGRCVALTWHAEQGHYRCGALVEPERVLRFMPAALTRRWVQRWISAGSGCDAALDIGAVPDADLHRANPEGGRAASD